MNALAALPRPRLRAPALAGVALAHALGGWALLQLDALDRVTPRLAPLFVELVAVAPVAAPPPPALPPPSLPRLALPRPPVDVPQVSLREPEPTVTTTPLQAVAPPAPPPAPPLVVVAPAPPASAPAAEPKTVSADAVQYLQPPSPAYPSLSRRLREAGRVVVRVLVDADGAPRQLGVQQSSGHARLDDSALSAVRGARFRPYRENGAAQAVWVLVPIVFALEG